MKDNTKITLTYDQLKRLINETKADKTPKKYEHIVFLFGDEADEALEILTNEGNDAVLNYLMDFYYPDEGTRLLDDLGWWHGDGDTVFEIDDYVISYNLKLGYIGLVRKL